MDPIATLENIDQVDEAIVNSINEAGTDADETQGETQTETKPDWNSRRHVFAKEHPAHKLLKYDTTYGRDPKDENKQVIETVPAGFSRIMIPNLFVSDTLDEAERLCRMHGVNLRDEWRFAVNQITEAVIHELKKLPVPENYKEETVRLSSAEKAAAATALQTRKSAMEQLKEEGRRMREELARRKAEIEAETARQVKELTGKDIPIRSKAATASEVVVAETTQPEQPLPVDEVPAPPIPQLSALGRRSK